MRVLCPFLNELPKFSSHQLGFYWEFYRGITEALRDLGHEAIAFPFAKQQERAPGEVQALHRILSGGRVDTVLDLCCWGYGLSHFMLQKSSGENRPIYDMFNVPYVGVLLDHPYNQAINGIVARRLYAAYPDLGHPEQMQLAYPDLALGGSVFAPPAVRADRDYSAGSRAQRDIDVLFVGTLTFHALERFWRDPSNGYWRASCDPEVCDAIANGALAAPERSFHRVVQETMARAGPRPQEFALKPQLRAVEWYLRTRFRHDAVLALAKSGLHMHVVGSGWETVNLPANVTRLESIDYDGMHRLASRARICLDSSTYLDGANDRVFAYALNGAVCFTNAAGYLRGQFDGGMRYYSMLQIDSLVEAVQELLGQPARLREAGDQARERVLTSHTWRHRINDILAAVRGFETRQ